MKKGENLLKTQKRFCKIGIGLSKLIGKKDVRKTKQKPL
jgi:hypothetical protein